MSIESLEGRLAGIFKALGDPTRLSIFETLRCCSGEGRGVELGELRPAGSLSVGEVCCRLGGTMSTISHHLKELRLAGLIRTEKRGRWIYCSVDSAALELVRSFAARPYPELCPAEPVPASIEGE